MTREERNIKLKHLITCMKCEVSGKVCDENCPTQYAAGNMGEIIENLEAISEIMEQTPCEDAISRQYLLDNCVVDKVTMPYVPVRKIENAPPVIPQEKTGKWEVYEVVDFGEWKGTEKYKCSKCGEKVGVFKSNFCPNCGRKMVSI